MRLKMAKNGPLVAEMSPKGAKTAQYAPKCPQMPPNLGAGFHYVRPPYHHVFGPPTFGWRRLAATLLLKMADFGNNSNGQQGTATPTATAGVLLLDISGTPIA